MRFSKPATRAIALVFLMGAVSSLAPAVLAAPPTPAATPALIVANDSWAYGTDRWFNMTQTTPMGVHTIHAQMSWYTVFSRTNLSASLSQLSVERTVASNFTVSYCSPDCTNPTLRVDMTHSAYEHAVGFLNMTRTGLVYEGGLSVPATAIVGSSARADGRLSTAAHIYVETPQGAKNVTETFDATGQAVANLDFTPPLGLLPNTLNVGDTWNATSAYSGGGNWAVAWTYTKTNASGATTTTTGSPSGSLNLTGNVSVDGRVVGSQALPEGTVLPCVTFEFSSDLTALDGIILLPAGFDLFSFANHSWDGYSMGFANMQTHQVAVQFSGDFTSFRLRAASSFYGTNDSAVERGESMRGSMGVMSAAPLATASVATGVPTTDVSAVPVSVADANAKIACLATNTCATTPTSPPPAWQVPWEVVIVVAFVVAVVAFSAAVAVVVSRRRRRA